MAFVSKFLNLFYFIFENLFISGTKGWKKKCLFDCNKHLECAVLNHFQYPVHSPLIHAGYSVYHVYESVGERVSAQIFK